MVNPTWALYILNSLSKDLRSLKSHLVQHLMKKLISGKIEKMNFQIFLYAYMT